MRPKAFEVYGYYLAIRQHFTSDYDFFQYNGKVRVNIENFKSNRNYGTFQKLCRVPDVNNLILANFVNTFNPMQVHPWFLLGNDAKLKYNQYIRERDSISYLVKEQVDNLAPNDFTGQEPNILQLFWANEISPFTMVVLNATIGFLDRPVSNSALYEPIRFHINKFSPFVIYKTDLQDYIRAKNLVAG